MTTARERLAAIADRAAVVSTADDGWPEAAAELSEADVPALVACLIATMDIAPPRPGPLVDDRYVDGWEAAVHTVGFQLSRVIDEHLGQVTP